MKCKRRFFCGITAAFVLLFSLSLSLSACGANAENAPSSPVTAEESASPSAAPPVTSPASDTGGGASAGETPAASPETQPVSAGGNASPVYFTAAITPEGLQAVYDALEWSPTGSLAVKVTTGEPPNSNYLRQELIGELVASLEGTYVECNTAYGGGRSETAMHYQVAEDHGFTPVDIQDEHGSAELAVNGGEVLQGVNYVGASFADYDSYLVLSHFKGHAMAGFGGAVKNISIGMSSGKGKVWIHSGGARTDGGIFGDTDAFQMAMAEAGLSVSDALENGESIVYINVMNRLSVDCDCNGNPAEPDIHDIGILASHDPVALDKACLDLIWEADGNAAFVKRVEDRKGFLSLSHGEEIGLGTQAYELVRLD